MAPEIHPETRLGPVHLTVRSLDRQIDFYQRALGLQVHWRSEGKAGLGAGGEDLLVLYESPGARRAPRTTGLYHFALLLPERRELARAIVRLAQLKVPQAPTDHLMTETTYLSDPEGNGIELYVDTPEDGWFGQENGHFVARDKNGVLRSGRDPLDLDELFAHLQPGDRFDGPIHPATRVGHIHLHVADVGEAMRFYRDVLGFGVQIEDDTMGFVSAGGYHHHIGFNTWVGPGAPPPPPGSLGLRHYTVVLPHRDELARVAAQVRAAGVPAEERADGLMVADPSRNHLLLTAQR
ncbi:MAG: VOC family protein [Symbiobacterium sp.]|uniref:VOC family protein n=1 Tax=Symbiobacterium sp. TaxID=1971213 RepID=UPI003463F21D